MIPNKIDQSLFTDSQKRKGDLLLRESRLKIYVDQPTEIRALVLGDSLQKDFDDIRTGMQWKSTTLSMRCSCVDFKLGSACEHLWALLHSLSGTAFQSQSDHHQLIPLSLDHPQRPVIAPVPSLLREWELMVKKEFRNKDIDSVNDATLLLWYGIDLRAPSSSNDKNDFPIHLFATGGKNQKKLKWFYPSDENRLQCIDRQDQQILSILAPYAATNLSPFWRQRLGRHKRSVCFIPYLSIPLFLEQISKTKRLFQLEKDEPEKQELELLTYEPSEKIHLKIFLSNDTTNIEEDDNNHKVSLGLKCLFQKQLSTPQKNHLDLGRGLAIINETLAQTYPQPPMNYLNGLAQEELWVPKHHLKELGTLFLDHLPLSMVEGLYHLGIEPLAPECKWMIEIKIEQTIKGIVIIGQAFIVYPEITAELFYPLDQTKIEDPKAEDRAILRDEESEDLFLKTLSEVKGLQVLESTPFGKMIFTNDDFMATVAELNELRVDLYFERKKVFAPTHYSSKIRSNSDWFEVKTEISYQTDLPQSQSFTLQDLVAKKKTSDSMLGFLTLDQDRIGLVPEDWLKKQLALLHLGRLEGEQLFIHHTQGLALELLLDKDRDQLKDLTWNQVQQKAKALQQVEEFNPSQSLTAVLRDYQKDAIRWLLYLDGLDLGGCLADDMGLGKTLQILAFLNEKKERKSELPPHLIVMPKTLITNWLREAEKFAPNLKVEVYEGSQQKRRELIPKILKMNQGEVLLITYGTMRRDAHYLREINFDLLIMDEAQVLKEANSLTTKSVQILKSRNRFALSGTPAQNRLSELLTLFQILTPQIFNKRFTAKSLDKTPGDITEKILKSMSPFILRRTKKEVLSELPEKTEVIQTIEMPHDQNEFYQKLKLYYQDQFKNRKNEQTSTKVFEALLRLRQAACHPLLVDKNYKGTSGKIESIVEKLFEIREINSKALVFSQFTSLLEILAKRLDEVGIQYCYLDGKTAHRQNVIDDFTQKPEKTVFLLSIKAAGFGLNLTEANYAFILDPWWNPTVEAQAIDRMYRMGQENKVFAYKMISEGTVEEKILKLQETKNQIIDQVQSSQSFNPESSLQLMGLLLK